MLKVWNVVADRRRRSCWRCSARSSCARGILDSIHAFGASTLGMPFLIFIGDRARWARSALIVSRLDDLRSRSAKLDSLMSREAFFLLNNLVLVGALLRDLLGHVLPADLRGADRARRRASGRRGSTATRCRWRSCWCCWRAIGPVIAVAAGDRSRAAARSFGCPLAVRRVTLVALLALHRRRRRARRRWSCSCFVAFVLAVVGQEFWRGARARRAMTSEPRPRALVSAGRAATAAATAATSCTSGSRSCSSASRRRRRSSTSATCGCRRGRPHKVGGYTITYVRPTAGVVATRAGTGAPITFGAVLDVRKGDKHVGRCTRRATTTRPRTPRAGRSGASSTARPTSEVGVRWGLRRDLWTADRSPTSPSSSRRSARPTRKFAEPAAERPGARDRRDRRDATRTNPPPATLPHDRLAAGRLDLDRRR